MPAIVAVANHRHALVHRQQRHAVRGDEDLHECRSAHAEHGQLVAGLAEGSQRNARGADFDESCCAGGARPRPRRPQQSGADGRQRAGLQKIAPPGLCDESAMANPSG